MTGVVEEFQETITFLGKERSQVQVKMRRLVAVRTEVFVLLKVDYNSANKMGTWMRVPTEK